MKFFKRKPCVSLYSSMLLIAILLYFTCSVANAKVSEKIGIFYSYENVAAYEKVSPNSFERLWGEFVASFEKANLEVQYICNISGDTQIEDLGVRAIIFPLALDIAQIEANFLSRFVKTGGKLVLLAGIGQPSSQLKSFLKEYGITLNKNIVSTEVINLKFKNSAVTTQLPVGSHYSTYDFSQKGLKIAAKWEENREAVISGNENIVFSGYTFGQSLDKEADAEVLLATLEYFFPDILDDVEKEIKNFEYIDIVQNIEVLKERASNSINLIDSLNLNVSTHEIKKAFKDGEEHFSNFNSSYLIGQYTRSRREADFAKNKFALVLSLSMPVRKTEIRAIWLDRGTIVKSEGPRELKRLIKDIAKIGFNVIFFETINAGFPIYPSKILPQNPLTSGWDPLKVAIEAAHESGIELHAWVWTFAVGNKRHNFLIGESSTYKGPIIAQKGRFWALSSMGGKVIAPEQYEVWVSPANKKACYFLTNLFSEIVTNYDIDGFQLDYIRFPFQKKEEQFGFDLITKLGYKKETGKRTPLNGNKYEDWINWKTKKVNEFVMNVSRHLKSIKPNLKISVAVFALPRDKRIEVIHQDWELWASNKWVDLVFPFYYSYSSDVMREKLINSKEVTGDRAIIIPSFNLSLLSEGELAERIIAARDTGALGISFFAYVHLDKTKKELLHNGPYRESTYFIPYRSPALAISELLNELVFLLKRHLDEKNSNILTDNQTKLDVLALIDSLQKEFQTQEIMKNHDLINNILFELQMKIEDIFSLDKYLNKGARSIYLTSYIEQIRSLLSYLGNNKSQDLPGSYK